MISPWLKKYLNEEGYKKIEAAIIEAEKTTRGEIVPIIVQSSSTNWPCPTDHLYSWSALLLFC